MPGTPTVVGGASEITATVFASLTDVTGGWDRLGGADHIETAALAAQAAVDAGARPNVVAIASGDSFPDAVAAGPAAIRLGGVLLLTPTDLAGGASRDFLAGTVVQSFHIAGGTAAVTSEVAAALASAAGLTD